MLLTLPEKNPPLKAPHRGHIVANSKDPISNRYQRRRLRLGALLFQLRYYMQAPEDIAADVYRRGPHTYAQIIGERVLLVDGDRQETIPLEEAIARCKEAIGGAPLHG